MYLRLLRGVPAASGRRSCPLQAAERPTQLPAASGRRSCPLPAADAVATVHLLKEELPTTVKKTEVKVLSFEEKMKADAAEAKTRACGRSRSRSRLRFCSAVTEPQAHN